MAGRNIQNGQLTEDTSYLGTDKFARVTAHYASSWMVDDPETDHDRDLWEISESAKPGCAQRCRVKKSNKDRRSGWYRHSSLKDELDYRRRIG
jgi:hypothetical protein